jgi:hypothetical protein
VRRKNFDALNRSVVVRRYPAETVETALKQCIENESEDVRHFWLGEDCPCTKANEQLMIEETTSWTRPEPNDLADHGGNGVSPD